MILRYYDKSKSDLAVDDSFKLKYCDICMALSHHNETLFSQIPLPWLLKRENELGGNQVNWYRTYWDGAFCFL